MLTLFVVTKMSEMLVEHLVSHTKPKIVIAPSNLVPEFAKIGISAIPVVGPSYTVAERDAAFAVDGLPGVLDGVDLIDGLPAWKMLGIDRLRFWYNPTYKFILETFDTMDFTDLVITFDINSFVPWAAAAIARERGIGITGIKVDTLSRREIIDHLNSSPVDRFIVATEKERQMVMKMTSGMRHTKVVSVGLPSHEREESDNLFDTTAILFESQHDWKFMQMMQQFLEIEGAVVCVRDNREWKNLLQTFPNIDKKFGIREVISLFQYERVFLPAYYEDIVNNIPANTEIIYYDVGNTERAIEFSEAMK